jgi:hypothetical protein
LLFEVLLKPFLNPDPFDIIPFAPKVSNNGPGAILLSLNAHEPEGDAPPNIVDALLDDSLEDDSLLEDTEVEEEELLLRNVIS